MNVSDLEILTAGELPVPQDRPFRRDEALRRLGHAYVVQRLVRRGLLVSPLVGIYHVHTLPDSLQLRLDCLKLILPRDSVVCDRTAGWLHGAQMILAPGDHLVTPQVSVYLPQGRRLRNGLVRSGARKLLAHDVMDLGGVRVTSPLRTACDLGRLLHRDQAFAALISLLRHGGFERSELLRATTRFVGYRGVCQLRELAPKVDPRIESPGEAALLLRWTDQEQLPPPVPQHVVVIDGHAFRVDLALPDRRYGAEYDGEDCHGPEQEAHDSWRRGLFAREGWLIDAFRKADVYGQQQNAEARLIAGIARAGRLHRDASPFAS